MLEASAVPAALVAASRHVHASFVLPAAAPGAGTARALRGGARRRRHDVARPQLGPGGALGGRAGRRAARGRHPLRQRRRGGRRLTDARTPPWPRTVLAARGPLPVVKLGADGALAHDGCRLVHVGAPVVDVVDTVGAGDSFDAGFLCGRLSGLGRGPQPRPRRRLRLAVDPGGRRRRRAADAREAEAAMAGLLPPPAARRRGVRPVTREGPACRRWRAILRRQPARRAARRHVDLLGQPVRARGGGRDAQRGASSLLCVESTANQVNQDGGYTGMTPAGFRDGVRAAAAAAGVPADRLVLGGDHLGPYPWRDRPAAAAMAARAASSSAAACSPATRRSTSTPAWAAPTTRAAPAAPLDDETATARTVELCRAAEAGRCGCPARGAGLRDRHGGAGAGRRDGRRRRARVTSGAPVERTLELARGRPSPPPASRRPGSASSPWSCSPAWSSATTPSSPTTRPRPPAWSPRREPWPLVFEAHSTDYQAPAALARAGRRRLRHPQGRPLADVRPSRGPVRPRGDRAGVAREPVRGRALAAARDAGRRDARRPASLGRLLRPRRGGPAAPARVQLQRPLPLLLVAARSRPAPWRGCSLTSAAHPIPLELLSQYPAARVRGGAGRRGSRREPAALIRAHIEASSTLYGDACGDA